MVVVDDAWHPVAAYLYVLQLDDASLAWEYLRRNPDYRQDWLHRRRRARRASHWGLRLLENPHLDARQAHPNWFPDPLTVVHVYPDADPPTEALPFSLWTLPGDRQLLHDGRRLLLMTRRAGRVVRLSILPELADGMGYVYTIRAERQLALRWRSFELEWALLTGCSPEGAGWAGDRPGQAALAHLRTLQALDGVLAGASQRRVAEVLFGPDTVARDWHSDGDLRAQVRRLIRRGWRLVQGDYRRLLRTVPIGKGRSGRR